MNERDHTTDPRIWTASNSDPALSDPAFGPGVVRLAMDAALDAARRSAAAGEVPVGAAVFTANDVVAAAGNGRERDADPTGHAEIIALRKAARSAGAWRLEDCGIAVTLEPCPMCAGAMVNARIRLLVYGATDPKAGAAGSLYNICQDRRLNHRLDVIPGYREQDAAELMTGFFASLRDRPDSRTPEAESSGPRSQTSAG